MTKGLGLKGYNWTVATESLGLKAWDLIVVTEGTDVLRLKVLKSEGLGLNGCH